MKFNPDFRRKWKKEGLKMIIDYPETRCEATSACMYQVYLREEVKQTV